MKSRVIKKIKFIFSTLLFLNYLLFFQITPYSLASTKKNNTQVKENELINLNVDNYLIGPGDILKINVFDAKEFSGNYEVLVDGFVYLPLIGKVFVSGLSIELAKEQIEALYSKELLRPTTHIVLEKARPLRISLVGEVQRPGIYSLTSEEVTQTVGGPSLKSSGLPTLVDAIQKAGGITQYANLKSIKISRIYLNQSNEKNYKTTQVNILDLLQKGDQDSNPYLFDGDIINITKADSVSKDIINIAKANLSPSKITVYMVGQVQQPGPVEIKANTPLNQAISYAGGRIKWKGDPRNVQLIRVNRNGTITNKRYKLNARNRVSEKNNPSLSDGDIVIINSTLLNSIGTGLAEVTSPLSNLITGVTLLKLLE